MDWLSALQAPTLTVLADNAANAANAQGELAGSADALSVVLSLIIGGAALVFALIFFVVFLAVRAENPLAPMFLVGSAVCGIVTLIAGAALVSTDEGLGGLFGMSELKIESLTKDAEFAFSALPDVGILLFLIVPLVLGYTIGMYVMEKRRVGWFHKTTLVMLRVSAIALLLLILFQPGLTMVRDNPRHSTVVVLVDTSESMNQTDLYVDHWYDPEVGPQRIVRSEFARGRLGRLMLEHLEIDAMSIMPRKADRLVTQQIRAQLPPRAGDSVGPLQQLEAGAREAVTAERWEAYVKARWTRHRENSVALLSDWVALLEPRNAGDVGAISSANKNLEKALTDPNELVRFWQFVDNLSPRVTVLPRLVRVLMNDTASLPEFIATAPSTVDGAARERRLTATDRAITTILGDQISAVSAFGRTPVPISGDNASDDNAASGNAATGNEDEPSLVESSAVYAARNTPYGPMDSFTMLLQWRRMLRLYRELRATNPELDLERVIVLGRVIASLTEVMPALEEARSTAELQRSIAAIEKELKDEDIDEMRRATLERQVTNLKTWVDERERAGKLFATLKAEFEAGLRAPTEKRGGSADSDAIADNRAGDRATDGDNAADDNSAADGDEEDETGFETDPLDLGRHLIACANGLRRIDIALEVLHPRTTLGQFIGLPKASATGTTGVAANDSANAGVGVAGGGTDVNVADTSNGATEGDAPLPLPEYVTVLATLQARDADKADHVNRVVCYAFHSKLESVELPLDAVDSLHATGARTAISGAIEDALERLAKQHVDAEHVGGIVVVSDGLTNTGALDVEAAADVQLDTVAIGSRETLRRLQLDTLSGPNIVTKGSNLQMTIKIRADREYQYPVDWTDGSRLGMGKDVRVLLYRVIDREDGEEGEMHLLDDFNLIDNTPRAPGAHGIPGPRKLDRAGPEGEDEYIVSLLPTADTQDLQLTLKPKKDERGRINHFKDWEQVSHFRVCINYGKYVDEDTFEDNYADIWVLFSNRRMRVLHIDSRFRYEFRYASLALKREPSLLYQAYVTTADRGWPQPISLTPDPGQGEFDAPPEGFDHLVAIPDKEPTSDTPSLDEFDVVILGDVAPSDDKFPAKWFETLKEWVEKDRGGLIIVAGETACPRLFTNSPLEHLLPVKLARRPPRLNLRTDVEKPYMLTPEGANEEVFRLDQGDSREQNIQRWSGQSFPRSGKLETGIHGFFWFAPYPEAKPGARVYVEAPPQFSWYDQAGDERSADLRTPDGGRFPLMASQNFGKGLVFYMASDDFWYIRGGNEPLYPPFWTRLVNWIGANRRLSDGEEAEIYTVNRNNPEFLLEDPIEIIARVPSKEDREKLGNDGSLYVDEENVPVLRAIIRSTTNPDLDPINIKMRDTTGRDAFKYIFVPPETGNYEVYIQGMPETRFEFLVKPPQPEREKLPSDYEYLQRIAHPRKGADTVTHFHLPPQIGRVRVEPLRLENERNPVFEPLWDAPFFFFLAMTLLGCEWIIRKRSKLL